MQKRNEAIQAQSVGLTFFHDKGFVAAFNQASRYAGKNGKVATMPDIIDARLASELGTPAWESYFTTMSAEYVGFTKGGNQLLIVAHGVGPMSTIDGILEAYSYEFKDTTRSKHGGRISRKEFLKLESGAYGDVSIVDLQEYLDLYYQYPFIQALRASEAMIDPVLRARFGPRVEEYVQLHAERAREWHAEQYGVTPENRYELPHHDEFCGRRRKLHWELAQNGSDPFIVEVKHPSQCYYPLLNKILKGSTQAAAHLLSLGRLCHMSHTVDEDNGTRQGYESLVFDSDCAGWNDAVRLAASKTKSFDGLKDGAENLEEIIAENWQQFMQPTKLKSADGFYLLREFAGQTFTDVPKKGHSMNTAQPEFLVTSKEEIDCGTPVLRTKIGGYHMFVRYSTKEVLRLAPPGANAYTTGEFAIECDSEGNPSHHVAEIQFYKVEIDHTKRLMTEDQLRSNYPLMMSYVK